MITDLRPAACKSALLTAWEDRLLWALRATQILCLFSSTYFISYNFITVYCTSTCSTEAELTALIYGLLSSLAAERGASSQCRAINTNQPVQHKATRMEVTHKVIPCTTRLQCQKRSWHVVAQIYGDQKKACTCICGTISSVW